MKFAAVEFLMEELKMEEGEISDIGKFTVQRKDTEGNDKIYLVFELEESCEYITKKQLCVEIQT